MWRKGRHYSLKNSLLEFFPTPATKPLRKGLEKLK